VCVKAIHVIKSYFIFVPFFFTSANGLYNSFPRCVKSLTSKKIFTRIYRYCEHVAFFQRDTPTFHRMRLEIMVKRNFAKIAPSIRSHPRICKFGAGRCIRGSARDANNGAIFRDTVTDVTLGNNSSRRYEGREEQLEITRFAEWKWNISRQKIRDSREEIAVYPVISSKRPFISHLLCLSR